MAQLVLPASHRRRSYLHARGGEPDAPRSPPKTVSIATNVGLRGPLDGQRGFLILIVDDDPLMTDMFPRRLRRVLHPEVAILTAATPDEARAMIHAHRPDAILCDYNLRHVETGLDVLRAAQEGVPHAARILLSGHTRREITGLDAAPVHAYIEKPMRLDEIIMPILDVITRETGRDLRGGDRDG